MLALSLLLLAALAPAAAQEASPGSLEAPEAADPAEATPAPVEGAPPPADAPRPAAEPPQTDRPQIDRPQSEGAEVERDDAPAPQAPPAPEDPATVALQTAVSAYLAGDIDTARQGFGALAALEEPFAVVADALVYLGELALLRGETASAEAYFARVLRRDPTWRVSPYDHPMEVVGLFELARDRLAAASPTPTPPAPAPRPRLSALDLAPFGVPQLRQDRRAVGAAFATTQALTAAATIPLVIEIARLDRRVSTWSPELSDEDRERLRTRARILRDAAALPAAASFYALWIASIADAAVVRRQRLRAVEPSAGGGLAVAPWVAAAPMPGGGLAGWAGVSGRW